jgi:hypothetical protein
MNLYNTSVSDYNIARMATNLCFEVSNPILNNINFYSMLHKISTFIVLNYLTKEAQCVLRDGSRQILSLLEGHLFTL